MCGIAGLIGWKDTTIKGRETVSKMREVLKHRGPDDNSIWVSENNYVYFSHSRLSILDLSKAGKQPMTSSCKRYIISYNGEIYNHFEIRSYLENKNFNIKWIGTSDTETLIESISKIGLKSTLELAHGMFAFAVFDKKTKDVFLVRDRFGEKPLYLLERQNSTFAFASEIISFDKVPNFKPILSIEGASNFFHRGCIAAPFSIWKNVTKLLPGSIYKFSSDISGNYKLIDRKQYWSVKETAIKGQNSKFPGSYEDAKKHLEKILYRVLDGQKLSDVPLGVFLSGGVDSSIVAALLQKSVSKKIKTFSIGFTEKIYDESNYAEAIASHLKTDHTTLKANPNDAIDLVEKMPAVYSEPFADASQIPTTLLCKLVKKYVSVALSGDGGDEVFTGYNRYLFAQKTFKILTFGPSWYRKSLSNIIKSIPPSFLNRSIGILGKKRFGDKAHKAADIMNSADLQDYYDKLTTYWPEKTIINHDYSHRYEFSGELGNIENMMLADQLNYLPNDILVKVDRSAMSTSLETRAPLLDHSLSEFAWRTPIEWRVDKFGGKKILREVLYEHVPRKLIDRPKQGFGMPVNEWLRGPLKEWAMNLLDKNNLPDEGMINGKIVRKIWNEHINGSRNWENRLWPILMWQQWSKYRSIS